MTRIKDLLPKPPPKFKLPEDEERIRQKRIDEAIEKFFKAVVK